MAKAKSNPVRTFSAPVDFVIITALQEERDAMLAKLKGAVKLDKEADDVHTFYTATVKSTRQDKSEYKVILTQLLNMGPLIATAHAVAVVNRWRPKYVLLVGIACGVRGEAQLGDVLLATQVADYTLGKQQDGVRAIRWEVHQCGASILDSANNVGNDWIKGIGHTRPSGGRCERVKGVIATGGDVISDDQVVARYSSDWPKLVGIEMESGGVAAGIHQTPDRPEFLMIKAVSDFGKDKHDADVKPWRPYACNTAAAFALGVIKSGPPRDLSVLDASKQNEQEEQKKAAERRWEYIQKHPIQGMEVRFLLKAPVGYDWFCALLGETRLSFSRKDKSFKLGQLLRTPATLPNTKERSRSGAEPVFAFWDIYEHEANYWVKRIDPSPTSRTSAAGFDATIPWSMLGVTRVVNLEDLAVLTDIGISIPARAYQVGIEEFTFAFYGETFSFSVDLSDHALDALHVFASTQHMVTRKMDPMPLGTNFSGVQLLDMFLKDMLPGESKDPKKGVDRFFGGLSGPDGRAISFYPTMPMGFMKGKESSNYTFTITTPGKVDTKAEIKKAKDLIEADPSNPEHHVHLASGYLYEGHLNEVVSCLQSALSKNIESAHMHSLLAAALAGMGRFPEALDHATRAVALEPDSARAHYMLGRSFGALDRDDEAATAFRHAVELAPSEAEYHAQLGQSLAAVGSYGEALASYRKALELKGADSHLNVRIALMLEILGETTEAKAHAEAAVRIDPKDHQALATLGRYLGMMDEHKEAVDYLDRAVKIEPDDKYYELLGGSRAALGQWVEAEIAFRRAAEIEPENGSYHRNLGVCVANQGKFEEALKSFEEAFLVDPSDSIAEEAVIQLKAKLDHC